MVVTSLTHAIHVPFTCFLSVGVLFFVCGCVAAQMVSGVLTITTYKLLLIPSINILFRRSMPTTTVLFFVWLYRFCLFYVIVHRFLSLVLLAARMIPGVLTMTADKRVFFPLKLARFYFTNLWQSLYRFLYLVVLFHRNPCPACQHVCRFLPVVVPFIR